MPAVNVSNSGTATAPVTVYTVPTGVTFYLTSCRLSYYAASNAVPAQNAILQFSGALLDCVISPLNQKTFQWTFPTPIPFAAGTVIQITPTNCAATDSILGALQGYTL